MPTKKIVTYNKGIKTIKSSGLLSLSGQAVPCKENFSLRSYFVF